MVVSLKSKSGDVIQKSSTLNSTIRCFSTLNFVSYELTENESVAGKFPLIEGHRQIGNLYSASNL